MGCQGTCGPSSSLGGTAPKTGIKSYYTGTPGNKGGGVASGCAEAMAAGGAVSYNPEDKTCYGVQGKRIIIGDTAESIQAGFEMVNFNFHTSGTQARTATSTQLSGPVMGMLV